MRVPFLDVKAAYDELRDEIDDAIARVLRSGWFILGGELEAFESEFATFVGARHCIGVANGLEALWLSLRAMGVGPGDEVIVPSNTYIATWLAVTQAGAMPVGVEPRRETYNLDAAAVEPAVTERTRVVCPVHLYGQPAELDRLQAVAREHDLLLLEDAAQAHGARYRARRVGGWGNTAAWSFYPGKNLGALGDGGAVTTDDDRLAGELRRLRNYGSPAKYVHEVQGTNSRLDELQAAILRVKLAHLDEWNARRRAVAASYLEQLAGSSLFLPGSAPGTEPVWHIFAVAHPRRDDFREALAQLGVETLVHYPVPPHLQGAYRDLGLTTGSFPVAEAIHSEVFSLPIGPHLSDQQVGHVIDSCLSVADKLS